MMKPILQPVLSILALTVALAACSSPDAAIVSPPEAAPVVPMATATDPALAPATVSAAAGVARASAIAQTMKPTVAPSGPLAPAIASDSWLNSAPLAEADLRGHPVLVEFWTYGCINCLNTVPAMRALDAAYSDAGLIIIGVHTPEFEREKSLESVRAQVAKLELGFPVALDNDMAIWRAFDNHAWPSLYLIDKIGVIRKRHIGELHEGRPAWEEMTGLIEALLAEEA